MDINIRTLGADPEGFLRNKADGTIMPACGLLGGSKKSPRALGDDVFIQEDNVLVEFNIPVATDPAGFGELVAFSLERIRGAVPDGTEPLFDHSAVVFGEPVLRAAGEQAFQNGCDPDWDAWAVMKREPIPYEKSPHPFARCAGGHIHVGFDRGQNDDAWTDLVLVRSLDYLIGVPLMLMEGYTLRRETFGMAGLYRPKPYGIEWRAPSNYWVGLQQEHLTKMAQSIFDVGMSHIVMIDEAERFEDLLPPDVTKLLITPEVADKAARLAAVDTWYEGARASTNGFGRMAAERMRNIARKVLV